MSPNVKVVMDTYSSIVSSHICTRSQDLLGMFPLGLWLPSFKLSLNVIQAVQNKISLVQH